MASKPAAKRPAIDWERIEIEYRAGIRSLREIGAEHSISHTAINKRAKDQGWARDLKAKIKAKAEALVSKEQVSREVSVETKITEALTVEVEAKVLARIQLGHRTDIGRSRKLVMTLLGELEAETAMGPELAQLGELMARPNEQGVDKLNDLYHKVIGLPGRIKGMKELSDSLRILVGLEREAYNLDSNTSNNNSFEDLVSDLPEANL